VYNNCSTHFAIAIAAVTALRFAGVATKSAPTRRSAFLNLKGAVAVVTGGNGGLGQRICRALAKEGAHIAVIYAQSRDKAEAVASELTSRHQINAAAFACDVTDGAAVQGLIGDVTVRFGRLDVLVNDAAYSEIMAVNLTGPMRLIKAVAPVTKAHRRGRIVNIASAAGLGPMGSSIAYAVSKAGLIHLTRCMAVALAPETLVSCRTRTAGRHPTSGPSRSSAPRPDRY
jgi:3-oxoacyl-[acyl-carrier protein] reductase